MSHTTIEHAYQLLLDEGFIYSKPRSGYYVSDIESLPVINRETYPNNDHLEIHNESNENSQFKFAFNLAEIDSENFPMHIFRKYAKTSLKKITYHYYKEAKFKESSYYVNKLHIIYLIVEA